MERCTIYIADDGTRFESKEACLEYEHSCLLKVIEQKILFWDYNRTRVSLSLETWGSIYYVFIEKYDGDALAAATQLIKEEYTDVPWENGEDVSNNTLYMYDEDDDQWRAVDVKVLKTIFDMVSDAIGHNFPEWRKDSE